MDYNKGIVKPFSDPCSGDLVTPVNSNIFIKNLISNLPVYRPGVSPYVRGVQLGASFGYVLYGPFTTLGPMRNSDLFASIGLMSTFGAIHILVFLFFLYGQGQSDGRFYSPPSNPTVINPPGDLFTSESWMDFTSGFWLGGSGGAAFAWFVYTNSLVRSLYEVFFVR